MVESNLELAAGPCAFGRGSLEPSHIRRLSVAIDIDAASVDVIAVIADPY
jgi:hypothetical protein